MNRNPFYPNFSERKRKNVKMQRADLVSTVISVGRRFNYFLHCVQCARDKSYKWSPVWSVTTSDHIPMFAVDIPDPEIQRHQTVDIKITHKCRMQNLKFRCHFAQTSRHLSREYRFGLHKLSVECWHCSQPDRLRVNFKLISLRRN